MAKRGQHDTATGEQEQATGDLTGAYVHVVRLKRFFNLRTLADYDAAQFNVMHMVLIAGKITPSEHFFRNGGRASNRSRIGPARTNSSTRRASRR